MLKHHNYENKDLRQILESFSHHQKVNLSFYCAKDVESLANDPRIIDCNLAVEQWLKGDQSVDLELARTNARNAWNAVNTAYCAISAAYYAVNSAYYADNSGYYFVSAVYSAIEAASAKSYNLYPNNIEQRNIAYNQFFKEYNQIAQNWLSYWNIPNFPKDEPDFPIFDFLQDYNLISCLLPKKENYYYLNLNGFNIKHVNEAELLKEIDTMHIKNILRRIINNDLPQQL